ncbi:MAG: GtrA family protein [Verrucomicrobiota bacterium]
MIATIREGVQFVLNNPIKDSWAAFIRKDAHPLLQFVKYGMCGVFAVILHTIVFYLVSREWAFPCHEGMMLKGEKLENTDFALQLNFVIGNTIGFLCANVATYLTNLAFVFKGGRHNRFLEFLYFTAIASIGFIIGMVISLLQLRGGIGESWAAMGTLIITSAIVNFLCRKFFVFKG